jgi:EAL domain-containing protein (putative c-di-GMP-specific phosphodiesterase class I)
MRADAMRRALLMADLRSAILEHRLEVEYQPVVEFATSRVTSVQALAGWRHAGELIDGDELMGIAETAGLTDQLGDRVLRAACRQGAAWRAAGFQLGLAVSCTFRQVSAPGFATSVLAALDEAGLPPHTLILQVAERVLTESAGPPLADLAALRGKGVRLAIDDFGTGYISLGHLTQLTADIIKIDPLFIGWLGADPARTMLTKTIVTLGHDLGIEVIAAGIERPEQIDQLRAMGCGFGQGRAIAAPVPAASLDGLPADLAATWRQASAGVRGPAAGEVADRDGDGIGTEVSRGIGTEVGDPACSPAS